MKSSFLSRYVNLSLKKGISYPTTPCFGCTVVFICFRKIHYHHIWKYLLYCKNAKVHLYQVLPIMKRKLLYEKLFCRVLFLPNWLLIKSLQKYSSSKSGWNVIWPQALFPTSKNMKMLVCQKWGDVINQRFRGLIFHVN